MVKSIKSWNQWETNIFSINLKLKNNLEERIIKAKKAEKERIKKQEEENERKRQIIQEKLKKIRESQKENK
jgi:hypothetical protein